MNQNGFPVSAVGSDSEHSLFGYFFKQVPSQELMHPLRLNLQ